MFECEPFFKMTRDRLIGLFVSELSFWCNSFNVVRSSKESNIQNRSDLMVNGKMMYEMIGTCLIYICLNAQKSGLMIGY